MQNLVRKRRIELHLTQQELSKKSKVSCKNIDLIEKGELLYIESKTMFKIATALECDIGDIFFNEYVVFTQQSKKLRQENVG